MISGQYPYSLHNVRDGGTELSNQKHKENDEHQPDIKSAGKSQDFLRDVRQAQLKILPLRALRLCEENFLHKMHKVCFQDDKSVFQTDENE